MKLALQIIGGIVVLFITFFLVMALLGMAIHAIILCAIIAVIVGVCRWQYGRWESRRLPSQRSIKQSEKHLEQKTEKALRDLERKVNKS